MLNRIDYLRNLIVLDSEETAIYRRLYEKEYLSQNDREEIYRKSHFLKCFAKEIPVVIDSQELIVGSLRFQSERPGDTKMNIGHITVDYRMILREGICGIKSKIEKLSTPYAAAFGEAVEAFCTLVERYAKEAECLGMYDVAQICKNVLVSVPQTFHEALQLVWFVHMFLHAEGMSEAFSLGRFDDYLYPFYARDIKNGKLTGKKAKELIKCFFIKTCEGDVAQSLTIGGDIENEVSYLCLEASAELKLQRPSVAVRIGSATTDKLWEKAIALLKCKLGMPAIFNDRVVSQSLQNLGIDKKDADNYGIVGCYEANPDGNAYGSTAYLGFFALHDLLTEFLALDKNYNDFLAFYNDFKNFFTNKYNTEILDGFKKNWEVVRAMYVSPFESACFADCLESGIPAELGGCKYTMAGINILGLGTLVDSLYVLKKLVFEDNQISYRDFVSEVQNNFPDKVLEKKCKNYKGKFGTDNPETNELARDISVFIADLVDNGEIYEGVIPYAGLFGFTMDIYSDNYPATPDGRLKGQRLSYGVGPSDFCVDKTATTILNSAANVANDRFADGNPLMLRVSEKDVLGEKGDMLLKILTKGYFNNGGFHILFNVADTETLKKAKETPEEYSDLVVRISGYSDYFTRLNDAIQNAIIDRE